MVEAPVTAGRPSPRLILVWGALLVLVGAIVAVEVTDRAGTQSGQGEHAGEPRMLLPVPVAQLGAIEIAYAGALHRFERDAASAWFYHGAHTSSQGAHEHQVDAAMSERIATAFTGLGRARIEREFPLDRNLETYGLANPQMLVLVFRSKDPQPLAQYAVGDIAPDTLSRYVMSVGSRVAWTIANYQIDNLTTLIRAANGEAVQLQAPAPKTP